jgi:putative selenium metabolism hydrolase
VFTDSIGNAVARWGSGSRVILYDSHLDTVGVGDESAWTRDPYGGILEDGVIYGRGACDDKGGIGSMVAGLRLMKMVARDGGLPPEDFTLYVVGIVQEENCEGLALSVLLEEKGIEPDCVVLGEPSGLTVRRGHRGRAEIEVITRGRSCHSSAPARGDNAIYKMTPVIEGIKWLEGKLGSHPFLGPGSIAVTSADSTSPSRNAIPDRCRIFIDRRVVPSDTRESIAREIDEIARFTGGSVRITTYSGASYKGYIKEREKFFPAWVTDARSPAVTGAAATFRLLFDEDAVIDKWDFSTDGNYSMGIKSIPTVGFGPGEEHHTHSTEDQVEVEQLWKASAFYALFPYIYSMHAAGDSGSSSRSRESGSTGESQA